MNTFILTLFVSVFSIPAFAGFNVEGTHDNGVLHSGSQSTLLKLNGHSVELGRAVPDAYGNFTKDEVMAMTLMLMDPLQAIPHGDRLRSQRHLRFAVQVVKGATYKVERRADRGYLRVPAMTLVKITIPATASYEEVGRYLLKNVTLTQDQTESPATMTRDLVAPRQLDGCEMQLYNLMAGPV